jgi:hypothetical protein
MPIRQIEIPQDITLVDHFTGEPINEVVTWKQFLKWLMLGNAFSQDYTGLVSAIAIDKAEVKDGKIDLAEEDWTKLKSSIESPQYGRDQKGYPWAPSITMQLMPYMNAVKNAKQV